MYNQFYYSSALGALNLTGLFFHFAYTLLGFKYYVQNG